MLIFLDIETTGLSFENDHVLEVYAAAYDEELDRPCEEFEAVIRPDVPFTLSPVPMKMHTKNGLLDDVKERGRAPTAVYFELAEFFDRYPDALLVGRNVGTFDRAFLEAKHPGISKALHYRCLDLSSLLTFFKTWPSAGGPRLPYAVPPHRARGDVQGDVELLRALALWHVGLRPEAEVM